MISLILWQSEVFLENTDIGSQDLVRTAKMGAVISLKPVLDLNEYLDRLSSAGMVTRILREVDPKYELASIAVQSEKKRKGAVLFESLKGHAIPVVTNLFSEGERICLAFGLERGFARAFRVSD